MQRAHMLSKAPDLRRHVCKQSNSSFPANYRTKLHAQGLTFSFWRFLFLKFGQNTVDLCHSRISRLPPTHPFSFPMIIEEETLYGRAVCCDGALYRTDVCDELASVE